MAEISSTPEYHIGEIIPYHFSPGLIVASYFASLVGSITTVELLHRRKTGTGWRSWAQLGACAVSFGLVAIWCMHFVGNRAIILGDGRQSIQLYYDAGFTALSVFIPIVFLFFGFSIADRKLKKGGVKMLYAKMVGCGIIAGLAVTGMHYVGNFSTTNYKLYNDPVHVIGAAIIAMSACSIALTLFFHQKEHWINHWYRRWACACVLAGAVSGMHWVASIGTTYQLASFHSNEDTALNVNMIVAVSVSFAACIFCFILVFLIQLRRRQLADRAQHVVLASATFDQDGRLLVTQEGLMPCQKITRRYNQQSFDDEFNVAHPVFQWIFRVSHSWRGVGDLIGNMRQHLRAVGTLKDPTRPGSQASGGTSINMGDQPYATIFREHFCVAANDLADHLGTRLENLGVLYDDIIMTGTLNSDKGRLTRQSPHHSRDVEAGVQSPAMFGKGQLLYVVRQVQKPEALRLETMGYRWATLDHVGDILARSMQVYRAEVNDTISRLRVYSDKLAPRTDIRGIQMACFALQPTMKTGYGDWNLLVTKDDRGYVPMVPLLDEDLTPWQQRFLNKIDGYSVQQLLDSLPKKSIETKDDLEREFVDSFSSRLALLTDLVPESFFRHAVFSSKIFEVRSGSDGPTPTFKILAFCIIPDVHSASIKRSNNLVYTPFNFFNSRQHIRMDEPTHGLMARRIHREFAPILAQASVVASPKDTVMSSVVSVKYSLDGSSDKSPSRLTRFFSRKKSSDALGAQSDGASEHELVTPQSPEPEVPASVHGHAFGGIMVSSDVTWTIDRDGTQVEMSELGTKSEAGVADKEEPTFANELFKTTCALWQRG